MEKKEGKTESHIHFIDLPYQTKNMYTKYQQRPEVTSHWKPY